MKRVILFGAPGSGKGTQAEAIEKRFGYIKVSTGDLIRAEVRMQSKIGLEVKATIDKGELIPDQVIVDLLKKRLQKDDILNGYIVDGFPRTLVQAVELSQMKVDNEIALYLKIGNENVIVQRLLSRLTCPRCNAIFSMLTNPPKVEGVCDSCGIALRQRTDDNAETIRNRISIYREQTKPVISYYREKGMLREIDASLPVESVFKQIEEILQ